MQKFSGTFHPGIPLQQKKCNVLQKWHSPGFKVKSTSPALFHLDIFSPRKLRKTKCHYSPVGNTRPQMPVTPQPGSGHGCHTHPDPGAGAGHACFRSSAVLRARSSSSALRCACCSFAHISRDFTSSSLRRRRQRYATPVYLENNTIYNNTIYIIHNTIHIQHI